jgi:splicing factor 3A subunit 1
VQVHVPEGLNAQDLDVIKLTAQFVARNGKAFLAGLSSREHTNPQVRGGGGTAARAGLA